MDPITHGLLGSVFEKLGFSRKGVLAVLIISAVLPDIDLISRLWGPEAALRYHRGITHSLLALVVVPIIVSLIAGGFKKGFLYFYALSFLGYASHIALDLSTQYGTRVLAPMDWNFYGLGHVFIFDQYLTFGMVLTLLFVWQNPKRARAFAVAFLVLITCYYGARVYYHGKATEFLRANLQRQAIKSVSAMPTGILRWWYVSTTEDGHVRMGIVDLFTRKAYLHAEFPPEKDDPAIEDAKRSEVIKDFLAFAKVPYVEVTREGGVATVKWRELTYGYMPGEQFVARAEVAKDGTVRKASFRFR